MGTQRGVHVLAVLTLIGLNAPVRATVPRDVPLPVASWSWTEGEEPFSVGDEVTWIVQFWRDVPPDDDWWYDPPRPLDVAVVRRDSTYDRTLRYQEYLDDQEVIYTKLPYRDTLTVRYRVRLIGPDRRAGVSLFLRATPDLIPRLGQNRDGTTKADMDFGKIGKGWVWLGGESQTWVRRTGFGDKLFEFNDRARWRFARKPEPAQEAENGAVEGDENRRARARGWWCSVRPTEYGTAERRMLLVRIRRAT